MRSVWLSTCALVCAAFAGCNGDEFEGQATNATGGGGGVTDSGTKDVITGDQGWVTDGQGTGGIVVDAAPDVTPDQCLAVGFHLTPPWPKSPSFDATYENSEGLVCVAFRAVCANGEAVVTGKPDPNPCPSQPFCWAANVSNCGPGLMTLEFRMNKGVGEPGTYCYDTFTGSEGEVAASCVFEVSAF